MTRSHDISSKRTGSHRLLVAAFAAAALATTPAATVLVTALGASWASPTHAQDDHGDAGGGHTPGGGGDTGGHTPGGDTGGHTPGGDTGGHTPGGDTGGHTPGGSGGAGGGGGHDTGGGCAGGGCAGGGHDSGGGHESGGGGGGKGPRYRYGGGEWPGHGTGRQHTGHASGVHGDDRGRGDETAHTTGSDRVFGGGSGLGGLAHVPEGIGMPAGFGHGPQAGPGPVRATEGPWYQKHFRYWGGWVIPDTLDGGGDDAAVADASTAIYPGSGGGSGTSTVSLSPGRCDGVDRLTTSSRVSGRNAKRIEAAVDMVAPGTDRHTPTPYLLLASYQEELAKPAANLALAGVYLGLAAARPVEREQVAKVSFALCIDVDDAAATTIAAAAEETRTEASPPLASAN